VKNPSFTMKRTLVALLMIPSLLSAQSPAVPAPPARPLRQLAVPAPSPNSEGSQNDSLPDNYQLTLISSDDQGKALELSVVTASPRFDVMLGEMGLRFSGNLKSDDSGAMLVSYALGWESEIRQEQSVRSTSSSTSGSVHVKMGEEVPIFRTGNRTIRLSIKKLQEPAAK